MPQKLQVELHILFHLKCVTTILFSLSGMTLLIRVPLKTIAVTLEFIVKNKVLHLTEYASEVIPTVPKFTVRVWKIM